MKKSQNQLLTEMLKDGREVTRLTAMHYGIMNLTARIADLRIRQGLNVECVMKTDQVGGTYGSFRLAS